MLKTVIRGIKKARPLAPRFRQFKDKKNHLYMAFHQGWYVKEYIDGYPWQTKWLPAYIFWSFFFKTPVIYGTCKKGPYFVRYYFRLGK